MNKKELKQAFEAELEKITVSKELKEKTLNAVNAVSSKKTSRIPYIRNIAAIFVVTLLCLSIYCVNDFHQNNSTSESSLPQTQNITDNSTSYLLKSAPLRSNSAETNIYFDDFSGAKNEMTLQEDTYSKASPQQNSGIKAISESDFLNSHPEAEKIEGGYVIYEGETEILYFFKNGILENTIIIN